VLAPGFAQRLCRPADLVADQHRDCRGSNDKQHRFGQRGRLGPTGNPDLFKDDLEAASGLPCRELSFAAITFRISRRRAVTDMVLPVAGPELSLPELSWN
jgi:hypothetical protein